MFKSLPFGMEFFDDFEAVFGVRPDAAYNQETIEDIVRNRHALENMLFVDRLLVALGIDKCVAFAS